MTNSFIFDYYISNFNTDYTFLVFYIVNFILSVIAYKLGFARKLPLLKSFIVYVILFIGTYITTIFAILQMPIVESLLIVSFVLAIYRFRMYMERKRN